MLQDAGVMVGFTATPGQTDRYGFFCFCHLEMDASFPLVFVKIARGDDNFGTLDADVTDVIQRDRYTNRMPGPWNP